MANVFRDGSLKTTGTEIDKLMPPVSRFGGGTRARKKHGIIEKLKAFFEKYFGLGIVELSKMEAASDTKDRIDENQNAQGCSEGKPSIVYEIVQDQRMVAQKTAPYGGEPDSMN